ncbi:MAG: HEAT repeat domain-containing protein [archaeon]
MRLFPSRKPRVRISTISKDFPSIEQVDWYFREKASPHDIHTGIAQLLATNRDKALMHLRVLAKTGTDKTRMVALETLKSAGEDLPIKVLMALTNSENKYTHWRSIDLLGDLGIKKAIPIFMKALSSSDPLVRASAASGLDKLGVNMSLYQGKNMDPTFTRPKGKIVPRVVQEKTHQSTTLLGGRFYNKVLIKGKRTQAHPEGYTAEKLSVWLRALGHDWKNAGWSYNPVEPILQKPNGKYRYYPNKDGTYRVSVGVIKGQNAGSYLLTKNSQRNKAFVTDQIHRITQELAKIGINYAHPKPENFIVQPRLFGRPRVYVIDFDYVWEFKKSKESKK